MNFIKINISNSREGILTLDRESSIFTCISDQKIEAGDCILHPQYSRLINDGVNTFVVDSVLEERPSKGDWKTEPATWRSVRFKKETIPTKLMQDLGYVREEKNDKNEVKNVLYI